MVYKAADLYISFQDLRYGTVLRNLQQPVLFFRVRRVRTGKTDVPVDNGGCFISFDGLEEVGAYFDLGDIPFFPIDIHAQRNKGAADKSGKHQGMGVGTCIPAACSFRLVCNKLSIPPFDGALIFPGTDGS